MKLFAEFSTSMLTKTLVFPAGYIPPCHHMPTPCTEQTQGRTDLQIWKMPGHLQSSISDEWED